MKVKPISPLIGASANRMPGPAGAAPRASWSAAPAAQGVEGGRIVGDERAPYRSVAAPPAAA